MPLRETPPRGLSSTVTAPLFHGDGKDGKTVVNGLVYLQTSLD